MGKRRGTGVRVAPKVEFEPFELTEEEKATLRDAKAQIDQLLQQAEGLKAKAEAIGQFAVGQMVKKYAIVPEEGDELRWDGTGKRLKRSAAA